MKDILAKYKIIAFIIFAVAIDFISIYCYFYFGLHYWVPKYMPAIATGTIGFILLKKNWIANLGFATALIIFCLPLLSQQYIVAKALIILQFIEVLIIYNGGFVTASLIAGLKRGRINLKKALPIIVNIALALFIMASCLLSLLTNKYTADIYVNKYYSTNGFKRVSSGGYSQYGLHGHYSFSYRNRDGKDLVIVTEGIYVVYDSIKGNG